MSFSALKKSSSSQLDKLNEQLSKMNTKFVDENADKYWKPKLDPAGNGYAVIRFLPAPEGEDLPFVRLWTHGFQGPTGQYYIENSLTTLGLPDPVSEYNQRLWNSVSEDTAPERVQVRKQKRKENFISNVYIVRDSANPENEGKVFLYKYGKKIFTKLNDAMHPQYEDETPINPFDFWSGANFQLKIRKVEGYPNYDNSSFAAPSTLKDSDEELEAIWNQQHSLQEIVDPKNFKSYEDLKARMNLVLGLDGSASAPTPRAQDNNKEMDFTPKFKEQAAPKMSETPSPSLGGDDEDEDDAMAFFKNLADN